MITIRLRLCSLLLVLVFALISCQQAEPSPEVIATETTIPSSPTEETKEESTATPPPENTSPAEEESYPAPQAESTTVSEGESYPAPQADTSTTGYPSPDGESPTVELMMVPNPYPGPDEITPTPTPSSPTLLSAEKFSLAPLQAGDTEIQGRGPAGLPIRLVDVTLAGDLIATGQIQDDGSFTIQLDKPLESNQRVGLKVDSLQGTPFAEQEEVVMQDAVLLMGENSFDIPAVGLVLTSQRVP